MPVLRQVGRVIGYTTLDFATLAFARWSMPIRRAATLTDGSIKPLSRTAGDAFP